MKLLTPMARTRPSPEQRLERCVGLAGEGELAGQCLVQNQQVDLIDSEFAGTLVERVQRRVVAVVGDPDLGLDEDVRAIDARTAYGFADLAFVLISSGGVDVPISGLQCRLDRCNGVIGRRLVHTETQCRHRDFVVQGQLGNGHVSTLGSVSARWECLSNQVPAVPGSTSGFHAAGRCRAEPELRCRAAGTITVRTTTSATTSSTVPPVSAVRRGRSPPPVRRGCCLCLPRVRRGRPTRVPFRVDGLC